MIRVATSVYLLRSHRSGASDHERRKAMSTIDSSAPVTTYGTPATGVRNGLGTTALVLGVIAVVLSWTVVGGIILGVLAVVFGIVGRGRAKRGEATNRK